MSSPQGTARASVCLIGVFPPATSGQGFVNDWFRRLIVERGVEARVIDVSSAPGALTMGRRLIRLPKAALGLCRLTYFLLCGMANSVYLGVSGGYGQLYDICLLAVCRLGGSRLFLHHDSYAYLRRRTHRASVLMALAGRAATHIVLCTDMETQLRTNYPVAGEVVVISSAIHIDAARHRQEPRQKLTSIGLIALLTRTKGVLEFLDVAEIVCRRVPEIAVLLAGPVLDPSLQPELSERLRSAPWVNYLGPVYGQEKARFFSQVDALILPTRFADEAEPAVISEALAYGAAVVARGRGCIPSMLSLGGGIAIPESDDFVDATQRLILGWYSDSNTFYALSTSALQAYDRLRHEGTRSLESVIGEMLPPSRIRHR